MVKNIERYFYWFYRLYKINAGKNLQVHFPLIVEGRGQIKLGGNNSLGKRGVLGVGEAGQLYTGDSFILDSSAQIKIGAGNSLQIGDNLSVGKFSRITVDNHWKWGNNINIAYNCQFFSREGGCGGKLILGNGCHIGDNTIIDVASDVIIGNMVALGPNCVIYSHDHIYNDKLAASWKGTIKTAPVIIEDGAWIASGVTILPGVIIGKKAIVAAGAVVTKNVESCTLVAGIPAKLIKNLS